MCVCVRVRACVRACVRAASSKRSSLLVSRGATQILLHVLVSESKDDECLSELLIAIHHLLAKLGPRGALMNTRGSVYARQFDGFSFIVTGACCLWFW